MSNSEILDILDMIQFVLQIIHFTNIVLEGHFKQFEVFWKFRQSSQFSQIGQTGQSDLFPECPSVISCQMCSYYYARIFNEISCESLKISWGQCPRVPGKRNSLDITLFLNEGIYPDIN